MVTIDMTEYNALNDIQKHVFWELFLHGATNITRERINRIILFGRE